MLAIGNEHKSQPGAIHIATDLNSKQKVYYVTEQEYPLQKPKTEALKLISSDWLLKLFKKYSLKKASIKMLLDFYKDPASTSIALDGNWKLRQAFEKLEERMLSKLKTFYEDKSADFEVEITPEKFRTVAFISASGHGKSWAAASLMLRKHFFKRKLYVFTTQINDPSLARLKERGKKTVFIDLEKIEEELTLSMFPVDSVILVDDVLETLPKDSPVRHTIRELVGLVALKGRHHKSKNGPGMSLIVCAHLFRGGNNTKILWTEITNLFVFPSSSPHMIKEFLTKKIGIARIDIENILKHSEGSRWVHFKFSGKPMFSSWKTGLYLL
jgi:hypothetical protein